MQSLPPVRRVAELGSLGGTTRMKRIALLLIHALVMCFAGYWCVRLATKELPRSGSTVEQWHQKVTQITNVTELHQKSVRDQEYILGIESLFRTLRLITVFFAGGLTLYALASVLRTARRRDDRAA